MNCAGPTIWYGAMGGGVRLLGRENNLMLLEYAGERMLSHIVAEHGDYRATEIAAELMAKLYAASEEPLPSALLPIRDRFAALFQRARDDQNAGCQTDYVHAAIIADQMMSNASELRGLHGDLHHARKHHVLQSRLAGDRSRRSGR